MRIFYRTASSDGLPTHAETLETHEHLDSTLVVCSDCGSHTHRAIDCPMVKQKEAKEKKWASSSAGLTPLEKSVARQLALKKLEYTVSRRSTNTAYEKFQQEKQQRVAQATNLVLAISDGNIDLVRMVCQVAPNKSSVMDRHGWSPLHHAAQRNDDIGCEIAHLLIKAGCDMEGKTKNGNTPLHLSAENNCTKLAGLLLAAGANLEAKNNTGNTPLHWCAVTNACGTATMLLNAKAALNLQDRDGNTPLEFAEIYRQTEIRDLLLRTRDERVLHGSLLRLIQVMMSKAWEQWQVSYDEMKDFNAVMFRIAARVKNKSLCRSWEIWYAPIRRIHSKKNKKEAEQVELSRQRSMARREADQAEAAGVDVELAALEGDAAALELVAAFEPSRLRNVTEFDGSTPLHLAAKKGHIEAVKVLIRNRADPHAIDKKRCTALHWAEGHEHAEVITFLQDVTAEPL